MTTPIPTEIKLRKKLRRIEISFDNGFFTELPCEYLRVYSPSAEVRGHGMDEPKLITDKQNVAVTAIEPIGNYAIKLIFDDGHRSGIYSWEILYDLATHHEHYWSRYLERLQQLKLNK